METIYDMLKTLSEKGSYFIDSDNNTAITKEHLGETLASNYEAAVIAITDGSLLETLNIVDKENAEFIVKLEEEKVKPSLILFYLQYRLNKKLPFTYKEFVFKDLKTFGQMLFDNKVDKELLEDMLRYNLLSHYLKVIGANETSAKLFKLVTMAESFDIEANQIRIRLIAMAILDYDTYTYAGKKFTTVEDFYDYLIDSRKMVRFSKTFKDDYYFMAWLLYLGKYEIIKKWSESLKYFDDEIEKVD